METPQPRATRLGDMLDQLDTDATERYAAFEAGQPLGPKTGFGRLDSVIGGWFPPGLHTLHGQAGAGKSALALQIAATCGVPALLISCEMNPVDLLLRHTARCQDVLLTKLKGGAPPMKPAELLDHVRAAAARSPELWLVDARSAWPDAEWITDTAKMARGTGKHVLVVIDSLHAWAGGIPGNLQEYAALNLALAACLTLAASLKAPILVVAERNRAKGKDGGQDAAAGTRKFEYSSETVLDLRRVNEKREPGASADDEPGGPARADPSNGRAMELILRKNRHGKEGERIDIDYFPSVMRFVDPNEARSNGAIHTVGGSVSRDWFS
jgi:replicative DNA helicase